MHGRGIAKPAAKGRERGEERRTDDTVALEVGERRRAVEMREKQILETLSLSATRVGRVWCQFNGSCGARWVRGEGLTCGCICYELRVKQRYVNFWGSEITIAGEKE
jgi:hypothetical protein